MKGVYWRPRKVSRLALVGMATFLTVAGGLGHLLSYLAVVEDQPSFTHADSLVSWADLLNLGYPALVLDVPTMNAIVELCSALYERDFRATGRTLENLGLHFSETVEELEPTKV